MRRDGATFGDAFTNVLSPFRFYCKEAAHKTDATFAKVTGFACTRIIGELRKLGIKKNSRQTVRNILRGEGISPGPDRTSDSWTNFVERHKETL